MGERELGDMAEGKKPVNPTQAAAQLPPPPPKPGDVSSGQRSATPYADQFLSKTPVSIDVNPMYQAQLKQQYALEQKIQQYVIPHLIDQETKRANMELAQSGANARAQLKYTTEYAKTVMDNATKVGISNEKNKTLLRATAIRDATTLKATEMKVNATLKVADIKGIKGTDRERALLGNEAKALNSEINTATRTMTELMNQKALNTGKDGKPINPDLDQALAIQMGSAQSKINALNAIMNEKLAPRLPGQGLPDFSNPMGNNPVWSMQYGLNGNTTDTAPIFSTTGPADDSDEQDETTIINSVFQD
jgi:hypothetical protein